MSTENNNLKEKLLGDDGGAANVNEAVTDLDQKLREDNSPELKYSGSLPNLNEPKLTASKIAQPGGFRREFLLTQAKEDGIEVPPKLWKKQLISYFATSSSAMFSLRHFAGLQLSDDDDDEEDEVDRAESTISTSSQMSSTEAKRRRFAKWLETKRLEQGGGNSVFSTFTTFIKSMVNTSIMFLPKAVSNGGFMFSSICFIVFTVLSMVSISRLVTCVERTGVSLPEMGRRAFGQKGKQCIEVLVILGQVGFTVAWTAFVYENAMMVLSYHSITLNKELYAVIMLFLFSLLAWIRKIESMAFCFTMGVIMLVVSTATFGYLSIDMIDRDGVSPTYQAFNSEKYYLVIGFASYLFEGVPTMIPIYQAMRKDSQHKYRPIVLISCALLMVFFLVYGLTAYMAFGTSVPDVFSTGFESTPYIQMVMSLYALVVGLTFPLGIFPIVKIMEGSLMSKETRRNLWLSNAFRSLLVFLIVALFYFAADAIDQFLGIAGNLIFGPLLYVIPPLLHQFLIDDKSRWESFSNIAVCAIGSTMSLVSLGLTIYYQLQTL